jgi:hypothetical protein
LDRKGNLIPPTSNVVLLPDVFDISDAYDESVTGATDDDETCESCTGPGGAGHET